ncbi:hypothetical protein ACJX0J_009119, partial [Zea mays]
VDLQGRVRRIWSGHRPHEVLLNFRSSIFVACIFICVFVRSGSISALQRKKGFLMNLIKGISREEWTRMWNRLKEVEKHFEYQYPSQTDDVVQMIWKAIDRKVPSISLQISHTCCHSWWRPSLSRAPDKVPPHLKTPFNDLKGAQVK